VRRHRLEGERARRRGERLSFALVEPSDDESVLGGASLQNVESDQGRAAVGFWLTPEARGRGVATHASDYLRDGGSTISASFASS
jgi:RimJ/RimL family protein N-acetyltransferase